MSASLFDVLVRLLALPLLSETIAPTILAHKAKNIDIEIHYNVHISCSTSVESISRLFVLHYQSGLINPSPFSREDMVEH